MGVACARVRILGRPMRHSAGGVSLQTFPLQPEVQLQLACERVDDGGLTRSTRFGVSSSNISSSQCLAGFPLDALFLSFPCMSSRLGRHWLDGNLAAAGISRAAYAKAARPRAFTELALQYTSARAAWKSRPRSPAHSEVAFLPLHFTCNSRAVGGILLSFTPRSDGIQAQAFHTQSEL